MELKQMAVVELRAFASKNKISLIGKIKKQDIIDTINKSLKKQKLSTSTSSKKIKQLLTDKEKQGIAEFFQKMNIGTRIEDVKYIITKSGLKLLDVLLYKFLSFLISNCTDSEITDTNMSKLISSLVGQNLYGRTDFHLRIVREGTRMINTDDFAVLDINTWTKRLSKIRFENKLGSSVTFSQKGISFLGGVLELIVIEIIDLTSSYHVHNGKIKKNRTVTFGKADLMEIIESDEQIQDVYKLANKQK
jgi:hypothetical protein